MYAGSFLQLVFTELIGYIVIERIKGRQKERHLKAALLSGIM